MTFMKDLKHIDIFMEDCYFTKNLRFKAFSFKNQKFLSRFLLSSQAANLWVPWPIFRHPWSSKRNGNLKAPIQSDSWNAEFAEKWWGRITLQPTDPASFFTEKTSLASSRGNFLCPFDRQRADRQCGSLHSQDGNFHLQWRIRFVFLDYREKKTIFN